MPKYDPSTNITLSDSIPMTDDHIMGVTSHAASSIDSIILATANSKTAVRFWDNGTFQNGTPNTGDMIVFTDSTTVGGGSGNATFYLTSDHTSGGTALCSTIIQNSCRGGWIDPSANYNPGVVTITSNKTIVVNGSKQSANGITLLSTTVLGSITYPNQPNGTTVTLFAIGISV